MNKLNKIWRKKHITPTTKRRLVDIGRARKTLRIHYQPQWDEYFSNPLAMHKENIRSRRCVSERVKY